jgi:hypothetical protein
MNAKTQGRKDAKIQRIFVFLRLCASAPLRLCVFAFNLSRDPRSDLRRAALERPCAPDPHSLAAIFRLIATAVEGPQRARVTRPAPAPKCSLRACLKVRTVIARDDRIPVVYIPVQVPLPDAPCQIRLAPPPIPLRRPRPDLQNIRSHTVRRGQPVAVAIIHRIALIDRHRRDRPWVPPLLAAPRRCVIPLRLRGQPAAIPGTERKCFVPRDAVHRAVLLCPRCVRPRLVCRIALHASFQGRFIRR